MVVFKLLTEKWRESLKKDSEIIEVKHFILTFQYLKKHDSFHFKSTFHFVKMSVVFTSFQKVKSSEIIENFRVK